MMINQRLNSILKKIRLSTFFSAFVFVLFLLSGPVSSQNTDYTINADDILKISVYNNPDLTTTTRVSGSGIISFPLIGDLDINGLTARQVEKKIAASLRSEGIVNNPQVHVFLEKFKDFYVTVLGEVNKPGRYLLEKNQQNYIKDFLSLASGLTSSAGGEAIITRKGKEKEERISVNLLNLFSFSDSSQNVPKSTNVQLYNGDLVYIPKAPYFYIYGEVMGPGFYKIEQKLTLSEAIAIAGGYTPNASKSEVRITGKKSGIVVTHKITGRKVLYGENNVKSSDEIVILKDDVLFISEKHSFYVLGEVVNSGKYPFSPPLSLLQALSIAGGVTLNASTKHIKIIRKEKWKEVITEISLRQPLDSNDRFFPESDLSNNREILAEDTILVPKVPNFFVFGQVKKPGFYPLQNNLTVMKALSIAGGLTDKASTRNIQIRRKTDMEEVTLKVNMHTAVEKNDVVIISESLF